MCGQCHWHRWAVFPIEMLVTNLTGCRCSVGVILDWTFLETSMSLIVLVASFEMPIDRAHYKNDA